MLKLSLVLEKKAQQLLERLVQVVVDLGVPISGLTVASNNSAASCGRLTEAVDRLTEQIGQFNLPDPTDPTMHCIRLMDRDTRLVVEGDPNKMTITDTQRVRITFGKPLDKKGNDASIQGDPTFASSDDSVTLVAVDGDPFSIDVDGQKPSPKDADGNPVAGVVTIKGDADLGDGVREITGGEPYLVTAGDAVGFGAATVGTPTEQA